MKRRSRRPWLVPFLVALLPIAAIAGAWFGSDPTRLPGPARDAFGVDEQTALYGEVMDRIADEYYREVDRDELLDRSLEGAVDSLDDRFSAYFDPKGYSHFQEMTTGEFQGVGLNVLGAEAGLKVMSVFDGGPADRGGVRAGDLIVKVGDRSLRGRSAQEATALIKGPAGTSVQLTLQRDGDERTVELKREKVTVPVVQRAMRRSGGTKVAHVRLSTFSSGAHGEVADAVRDLKADGAQGIVLDLRDNGGGLLNEAVLISSLFIGDGTIVSTKGRARAPRTFEATGNAVDTKLPMTVLVNEGSASASEIVAGALQDRDRADVVGTRTYGKGVFQEVMQLPNGGALDITVGSYFTPDGRNLGGRGTRRGAGIAPDVRAVDDAKTRRDEALDAALRAVARDAT
jgi:carboxyl-terminal processing protease